MSPEPPPNSNSGRDIPRKKVIASSMVSGTDVGFTSLSNT